MEIKESIKRTFCTHVNSDNQESKTQIVRCSAHRDYPWTFCLMHHASAMTEGRSIKSCNEHLLNSDDNEHVAILVQSVFNYWIKKLHTHGSAPSNIGKETNSSQSASMLKLSL